MQEVFLPLARTPPLAVTTRGNHTTLGHGPLPWVTVRNPIDPAGAVWLPPPNSAFKNACDSPTSSRFTFNRAFFGKQVSAREIQGLPGIFPTASDVAPCATRRNRARGVVTRTESAHFRLSRFPAGYLAYLCRSAHRQPQPRTAAPPPARAGPAPQPRLPRIPHWSDPADWRRAPREALPGRRPRNVRRSRPARRAHALCRRHPSAHQTCGGKPRKCASQRMGTGESFLRNAPLLRRSGWRSHPPKYLEGPRRVRNATTSHPRRNPLGRSTPVSGSGKSWPRDHPRRGID